MIELENRVSGLTTSLLQPQIFSTALGKKSCACMQLTMYAKKEKKMKNGKRRIWKQRRTIKDSNSSPSLAHLIQTLVCDFINANLHVTPIPKLLQWH